MRAPKTPAPVGRRARVTSRRSARPAARPLRRGGGHEARPVSLARIKQEPDPMRSEDRSVSGFSVSERLRRPATRRVGREDRSHARTRVPRARYPRPRSAAQPAAGATRHGPRARLRRSQRPRSRLVCKSRASAPTRPIPRDTCAAHPWSERHAASRDPDRLAAPGEEAHLALEDDPRFVVRSVDVKRRHVSRWRGDLDNRHLVARIGHSVPTDEARARGSESPARR